MQSRMRRHELWRKPEETSDGANACSLPPSPKLEAVKTCTSRVCDTLLEFRSDEVDLSSAGARTDRPEQLALNLRFEVFDQIPLFVPDA